MFHSSFLAPCSVPSRHSWQIIGENHTIAGLPAVGSQTEKSIAQREQPPIDPGPVSVVKTVQHLVLRSVESDGVDHSEGVLGPIAGRGAVELVSHMSHAFQGTAVLCREIV